MDVASLGIAVDSSQVTRAANENQRFAQTAGAAQKATEGLSVAASQANASVGGMATNMQRLNALAQQANGLNNLTAVFSRLGPWGIAFGVLADTALNFYRTIRDAAPQTEALFKEQDRLIGVIKNTYDKATDSARKFYEQTKAVVELQLRQQEIQLRQGLQESAGTAIGGFATGGNIGSKLNALFPGLVPESMRGSQVVREQFQPFEDAIIRLQQSFKDGTPAVREFQDEVAKIGNANPALQDMASKLIDSTKNAGDLAYRLEQVQAAMKLIQQGGGSLSERQRGILGIGDPQQVTQTTDAVDRMLTQLDRGNRLRIAEAEAAQQGARALAEYRAQALFDASVAANKGKFTEKQVEDFKRLKKEAGDAAVELERIGRIMERNDALANAFAGGFSTLVDAFAQGKNAADAFNTSLGSIGRSLQGIGTQNISQGLRGLFNGQGFSGFDPVSLGIGAVGSVISFITGSNDRRRQERERQQQEQAQILGRIENFGFRAQAAGLDTSTRGGALAQLELQQQQERLAEARAGGQAMAQLLNAQRAELLALNADWDKREADQERQKREEEARLAEEARKAALQRQRGFQDRVFAAGIDTSTPEGQLLALDRQFQREREEEIAAGGQAILDLEQAYTAERNRILRDANEEQLREQQRVAEEAVKFLQNVAKNVRAFLDGLVVGDNSILSPQQRVNAAQSQFQQQLALALGGNQTALENITTYAGRLLDEAKSFFASSEGYTSIYNAVVNGLQQVENLATAPGGANIVDAINQTTAAVNAGNALANAQNTLLSTANSLQSALNSVASSQLSSAQALVSIAQAQQSIAEVSRDHLNLMKNQLTYTANVTWGFNGQTYTLSNNMIDALNKIVSNTAATAVNTSELARITGAQFGRGVTLALGVLQQGGMVPMFEGGGMVGNGIWNRDSVLAMYRGGGAIGLAGGEGVINAPAAAAIGGAPVIDFINRFSRLPGNDNDAMMRGFEGLARTNASGFSRVVSAIKDLEAAVYGGAKMQSDAMRQEANRAPRPGTKAA